MMNVVVVKSKDLVGDAGDCSRLAELADRIRTWRHQLGFTQSELALRAKVSVSFLSMLERGERHPSYGTLLQFADAMGITLAELFAPTSNAAFHGLQVRQEHQDLLSFAQESELTQEEADTLIRVGRALFRRSSPSLSSVASAAPCAVDGCARHVLAAGLCSSHYRLVLWGSSG